ncbi:MAG: NAD-dependent epimerase/dehydratase family protein [Bryobacterales bacterium]|nr:NAD-dependent epimerase/dehydratase family protein [Bryobacterales bacterium]
MRSVLITGAKGFLGRNLAAHLRARADYKLLLCDLETSADELNAWLSEADVVFHLAGVNRPEDPKEFESGNAGFTLSLCEALLRLRKRPKLILSSSIQATQDNAYGISKRRAEEALLGFRERTGAEVRIFRLKNVFGKWCRPNYNSVVATFCYNVAHGLPLSISDPEREVDLVYVDDVVAAFLAEMSPDAAQAEYYVADTIPSYRIRLGELAGRIEGFRSMGRNLYTPDFSVRFNQCLYATYLSYVEAADRRRGLEVKPDQRGALAEFLKSPHCGQLFVSLTKPGITRGNHYHHTKAEQFFVVAGEGLIRMRHIEGVEVIEYRVRGEDFSVVDIPPGYTHSIENTGEGELVTLFWANQIFDLERPDTYPLDV